MEEVTNRIYAEVNCLDRLSLAMQQNYIPPISSIVVTSEEELRGLTVSVRFEPAFAHEFTAELEAVQAGRPVEISPVNVAVQPEFLFSLTECTAANMHISVSRGETLLCSCDKPIQLLPAAYWLGGSVMPELTAAFVTPNHPAVAGVLAKAGEYLAKWTGDPAFTGYQTRNPNNVKLQAAAIYAALQAENIAYMMPPQDFEQTGQRVRLADEVLGMKQGTCIDLALLYASCLEAAWINPLVILTEGHAFAGFHLEEQSFPECTDDDPSALKKRIAKGIDEICLAECTAFTAGKSMDFESAVRTASAHLDKPEEFGQTIDIKRCRVSGIRPVPQRLEERAMNAVDYSAENRITEAPDEIDLGLHGSVAEERELTKQAVWERKLLDLSLRNSLVNFRPGALNVQLMSADLARLEDEIARGVSFRILPMPKEQSFTASDSRIYELENNADRIAAISEAEFKNDRLRSYCSETELEQKLKKLHRSAKSSLEENGANTLYLALGFLKWYETDKSEKARYAPLVLVPIDLVRNLREKAYSLRLRDEESMMNVTLLELLRQDHGITISGVDPLPADESGADIPLVFNTVRKAVMARPRWDVEEVAFIGQFSFSRFIMWNDLRARSGELAENKVVASLMSGQLEWQPECEDITPAELDERVMPSDMAIPASADSSQLAAIYEAARGESFVLHGPPGTGKSQTITNLIANALYNGKSVLFVAEKMAALSVVQKRLEKIGLAPFCLELHSNKAQKSAVLKQLETTLNVGKIKSPEEYARTAESLSLMRKHLNEEMLRLHKRQPVGFSLYDAIAGYDPNGEFAKLKGFKKEYADKLSPELYDRLVSAVAQTAAAGASLGDMAESPLKNYVFRDYSPEIRDSFGELCEKAAVAADRERACCDKLAALRKTAKDRSGKTINKLLEEAAAYSAEREALDKERAVIEQTYNKTVFGIDVDAFRLDIRRAEQKWALPKLFGLKKLAKELDLHAKQAGTVTKDSLAAQLDKLAEFAERKKALSERSRAMGLDGEAIAADYCAAYAEERASRAEYDKTVGEFSRYVDLSGAEKSADTFEYIITEASRLRRGVGQLRERSALQRSLDELKRLGADEIAQLIMSGKVPAAKLPEAFKAVIDRTVIDSAFRADPAVGAFSDAQFEEEVTRYRDTLKTFELLTVQELNAKLSANIPNIKAGAGSSEVSVLQKAIRSGGRNMPIRKLFDSIPNLLRRMCPCMLMSPISVAQYIDPTFPKFDMVVFDEASQLPTAEAVGAIARGDSVVVVGDPRQLPPTSFFTANQTDEENFDKEDLESVLDDCLALTMPSRHLLWHYRSRHESLITFSNVRFYENKLLTFPSPDDLESKVTWVNTGGFYDKGKTKQNRAEAEAVVAEIAARLRDPARCGDSIGVVTFSIVQQNLIDDLLNELFIGDPELEAKANAMYEPIIIKNLENVQGDERDVILFSVGYGPDKDGKISMNFGPLNRDGGWRRLNVAVTRARKEMKVFSTLRPEQLDLSRTRAEGVAELKAFLEFAAKGRQALAVNSTAERFESDKFVTELAERLNDLGFETRCGVGCSGCRIDAGIIDPDDRGRYLLGIVCDGKRLAENTTARDRNIVQPSVLSGLGWRLVTVHALDWLADRDKVVEKVKLAAEQAIADNRRPPEHPEEPAEQPQKAMSFEFEREEAPSPLADRCEKYAVWNVPAQGTSKDFYLPDVPQKIAEQIGFIIEAEAPVSLKSVRKRILAAWGLTRSSSKSETVFLEGLKLTGAVIRENSPGEEFVWAAWQSPESYKGCRVPYEGESETKRPIDEICPEELAAAADMILTEQISMTRADLMREVARLFGHSRVTSANEPMLTEAIDRAIDLGLMTEADGRVCSN